MGIASKGKQEVSEEKTSRRSRKRKANAKQKELTKQDEPAEKKQLIDIETMPNEVMDILFSKLETPNLVTASEISTKWNTLADRRLWEPQLAYKWQHAFYERGMPPTTHIQLDGFDSYNEAFKSDDTRMYFDINKRPPKVIAHNTPYHATYKPVWNPIPLDVWGRVVRIKRG